MRAAASFHILSLPGSDSKMIKSDAALFWEFGSFLFNGDGNLELVESVKEMKEIVRKWSCGTNQSQGFLQVSFDGLTKHMLCQGREGRKWS